MNIVGHDVEEYEVKAILNKFGIINHEQKIAELSGGQQKTCCFSHYFVKTL